MKSLDVRKLTAKASGVSKVVKAQTMMTVRTRVPLMMNININTVMKTENNLNEKLLYEIITFFFNFLVNLVTKITSF